MPRGALAEGGEALSITTAMSGAPVAAQCGGCGAVAAGRACRPSRWLGTWLGREERGAQNSSVSVIVVPACVMVVTAP